MKRSSILAAATAGVITLLAASPAFAQSYDYDPFGAAFGGFFLFCWGIMMLLGLALFVLNVWMLVDVIGRQEYEFPGSNGNSKNLWLILLIAGFFFGFGWIVAIVYYFQVFKKVKRGTVAPGWVQPPAAPPAAPPAPPAPPAAPPAPPAPPAAPPAPPAPPAAPPAPPETPDEQR